MSLLVIILLLLAPLYLLSVAEVWRDANQRGQPGFIVAVLVAILFWPLSLIVWMATRPGLIVATSAPRSKGRQWAVVAIVGISSLLLLLLFLGTPLASIYANARSTGERARRTETMRNIARAYQMYVQDTGTLPRTLNELAGANERGIVYFTISSPHAEDILTNRYQLFPGRLPTDVIIRETRTKRSGFGVATGTVVAYNDGHVEWISDNDPRSKR